MSAGCGAGETSFSDLRCREVINLCDGARLGFVSDLMLDLAGGRITAILVPAQGGVLGFLGRCEDLVIPWDCIDKIGEDILFVRYEAACCPPPRGKKRFGA